MRLIVLSHALGGLLDGVDVGVGVERVSADCFREGGEPLGIAERKNGAQVRKAAAVDLAEKLFGPCGDPPLLDRVNDERAKQSGRFSLHATQRVDIETPAGEPAPFELADRPLGRGAVVLVDKHAGGERQRHRIGPVALPRHRKHESGRVARPSGDPRLDAALELLRQPPEAPHMIAIERPAQQRRQIGHVGCQADRGREELPPERFGVEKPALGGRGPPPPEMFDDGVGEPVVLHEPRIDRLGSELLLHEAPAVDGKHPLLVEPREDVGAQFGVGKARHHHPHDRPASRVGAALRAELEGQSQGQRRVALGDGVGGVAVGLHLGPEPAAGRADRHRLLDRLLAAEGRHLRPDLVEGERLAHRPFPSLQRIVTSIVAPGWAARI